MRTGKAALLAALLGVLALMVVFDVASLLTLAELKHRQAAFDGLRAAHPAATAMAFMAVYVLVAALSVPGGAIVLTLLGGALFGLVTGTVLVSFASTVGATLACAASRYLLRDWVAHRFASIVSGVDRGFRREGVAYLLSMRLVPVFPFFLVNLAMGITRMPLWTFCWVSQLGMLPATLVYVNLGTRLGAIESTQSLLGIEVLAAFALLGLLPLMVRPVHRRLSGGGAAGRRRRPRRFDRNLIVIGAGSAGLVSAYIAAAVRARVTLVESDRMGGDCLNTGCVPSKALIRAASRVHEARRAASLLRWQPSSPHALPPPSATDVPVDFEAVMASVREAIRQIAPHDSHARYQALGVECIAGRARLLSPWEVEIDLQDDSGRPAGHRRLSARSVIIATGARPRVAALPGLERVDWRTSETLWTLQRLPARLLVLGGGPIGCELAQAFARLGSRVTIVEQLDRILPREDDVASQALHEALCAEGIDVRLSHEAVRVEGDRDAAVLVARGPTGGAETRIDFDVILLALGREARIEGLGLEALGVDIAKGAPLQVDDFLRTPLPDVYACGDVAGRHQFTHVAAHMAWHACVNALFGGLKRFRVDWSAIPWCTFTSPEVATVGHNERSAREAGLDVEITRYALKDLDRAIVDGSPRGFVQVLTAPGSDRILGATVVGEHAAEVIAEFSLAMRHRIGLNGILSTIHVYPSWTEAAKQAAGQWKRAHAPERLLAWVERYHRWRRGG